MEHHTLVHAVMLLVVLGTSTVSGQSIGIACAPCQSGNLMTITSTGFSFTGASAVSFTSATSTGDTPTCSTTCASCSVSASTIVCALTVWNGIDTDWKVSVDGVETASETTFNYATHPFVEQAQGGGCTIVAASGAGFTNGVDCKSGTTLTIIGQAFDLLTPENNDISFRVPYLDPSSGAAPNSYINNRHLKVFCANEGPSIPVTTEGAADEIVCELTVPPGAINAATIAEVYVSVAGSRQKNGNTGGDTELPFTLGNEVQLQFDLTKTYTPTPTDTPTSSESSTSSPTSTPTGTTTETATATATPTTSPTPTITETTSPSPTQSRTTTDTDTRTPTNTRTTTDTSTHTDTPTESYSRTWSNTPTITPTDTSTSSQTGTSSSTSSSSSTPTVTPTGTSTPTGTQTPTSTPTESPTRTKTGTTTATQTMSRTTTDTGSITITTIPTHTPTATHTDTRSWTDTRTSTGTDTTTFTETAIPHWSGNVTTQFQMAPDDWDIRTASNAYRFQNAVADYIGLRSYQNVQILYTDAARTSRGHPDFSKCVVTWRIIDNGYGILSESSYIVAKLVTPDILIHRLMLNQTGYEDALENIADLPVVRGSTNDVPEPEPQICRTCVGTDGADALITDAGYKCRFTVNGEEMQAFVFSMLETDCNAEEVIGGDQCQPSC